MGIILKIPFWFKGLGQASLCLIPSTVNIYSLFEIIPQEHKSVITLPTRWIFTHYLTIIHQGFICKNVSGEQSKCLR